MRVLLVLLLSAACASTSTKPAPAATAAVAEADDGMAPRPYTADQLRAAFPVGTELKFRMVAPDKPVVIQHWVVMRATEDDVDMASRLLDEQGEVVENEGIDRTRWADLREHAAFPAKDTTITDETVTVPAGTYPTKLYTVRQGMMTRRFWFAPELPGPPVKMLVEVEGKVALDMQLLERHTPGR